MQNPDVGSLREWIDRQAIRECLDRYFVAVDRKDRTLLLSVFHADAVDDHGEFVGTPAEFADWAIPRQLNGRAPAQHMITTHYCELAGESAQCETYWMFAGEGTDGALLRMGGRYFDRFARRGGKWAIAHRRCTID